MNDMQKVLKLEKSIAKQEWVVKKHERVFSGDAGFV